MSYTLSISPLLLRKIFTIYPSCDIAISHREPKIIAHKGPCSHYLNIDSISRNISHNRRTSSWLLTDI